MVISIIFFNMWLTEHNHRLKLTDNVRFSLGLCLGLEPLGLGLSLDSLSLDSRPDNFGNIS